MSIVDEILEEVKILNTDELIEFNNKFSDLFNELKNNKLYKIKLMGTAICNILSINSFPYMYMSKRDYAPYESYTSNDVLWDEFVDWINTEYEKHHNEKISENVWEFIRTSLNEFSSLAYKIHKFSLGTADEIYPEEYVFLMYTKNGVFKEIYLEDMFEEVFGYKNTN